jgi:hypothetical protein
MNRINEPAREGFLYHIWLEKNFQQSLSTVDGQKVVVLEKGVRNYDAGPDFLNSLVKINGELIRGDVEIHSVAGDWYSHGHQDDPRYNNVVLHVVTMSCPVSFQTRRQDNFVVPTLNLDDFLEQSAEDMEKEDPGVSTSESKRMCQLSKMDNLTIERILEKKGQERFETKAERFAERRLNESWDQIFYSSILEAFGYSKNQIPFKNLAKKLPVETLWELLWNDPPHIALQKCSAYLFGAAGLLPHQQNNSYDQYSTDEKAYIKDLETYWNEFTQIQKIDSLKKENWLFFRLRPQNFPSRRLAAASTIVLRFMDDGFTSYYSRIVNECEGKQKSAIYEMIKSLKVEAEDFWLEHYSFDSSLSTNPQNKTEKYIIGTDRAKDIIVNVIIPALLAQSREMNDAKLEIYIKEILPYFPKLTENELLRKMQHQLFGPIADSKKTISSVIFQQALIQLDKFHCSDGNCAACLK